MRFFVALSLFLIPAWLPIGAYAKVQVHFHKEVELKNLDKIVLSDVAKIRGKETKLVAKLKNIELGASKGAGSVISSLALSKKIRASLTQEELKRISFIIPSSIRIKKMKSYIDYRQISKQLTDTIVEKCGDCRVLVSAVNLPPTYKNIAENTCRIILGEKMPKGNFSFQAECDDKKSRRHKAISIWGSAVARIYKKAPVARKSLGSGSKLRKGDIELKYSDVTFATDGIASVRELTQLRLSRNVRPGQVLFSNFFVRDRAIRRGQMAKIIVGEGDWQISLNGIAEEDGFLGDVVKVRNLKTKRVLSGQLVKKGVIRVE